MGAGDGGGGDRGDGVGLGSLSVKVNHPLTERRGPVKTVAVFTGLKKVLL